MGAGAWGQPLLKNLGNISGSCGTAKENPRAAGSVPVGCGKLASGPDGPIRLAQDDGQRAQEQNSDPTAKRRSGRRHLCQEVAARKNWLISSRTPA
jgi:hypothetical protein